MVTRPSVSLAFLSTPSARRATLAHNSESGLNGFLSTPSARRATAHGQAFSFAEVISIHALREEGDAAELPGVVNSRVFLSTPSARRATGWRFRWFEVMLYFYPRPPRGGRPVGRQRRPAHSDFYPRPPRGGRHEARQMGLASYLFLSTPSARRATKAAGQIAKLMQFLSTPSARRATCL